MIVVTGASGLVGGNLVRALLAQGRPACLGTSRPPRIGMAGGGNRLRQPGPACLVPSSLVPRTIQRLPARTQGTDPGDLVKPKQDRPSSVGICDVLADSILLELRDGQYCATYAV